MSYMATHTRLRRILGSAEQFTCPCGDAAKEWAYNNGSAEEQIDSQGRRYSRNPSDYDALCYRCHRLRDKERITHCPHGHPYSGDNVLMDAGKRKCKTCVYARNRRRRAEVPLTEAQRNRRAETQRARRAARRAEA